MVVKVGMNIVLDSMTLFFSLTFYCTLLQSIIQYRTHMMASTLFMYLFDFLFTCPSLNLIWYIFSETLFPSPYYHMFSSFSHKHTCILTKLSMMSLMSMTFWLLNCSNSAITLRVTNSYSNLVSFATACALYTNAYIVNRMRVRIRIRKWIRIRMRIRMR